MHWLLSLLFITFQTWAHQSSLTPYGNKIRWESNYVPVLIRTNTSDLPSATTRQIILDSMAQWNSVSNINLQTSTTTVNEVRFQHDFSIYGSAVIGVTEVSSNSDGDISSAIIRLNDNYDFKSTPGFYLGGAYLGDVLTHEFGHFLGLAHSEVLNSSMFYSNFSGQSTLGYDDKSAIRGKYDSGYGKITGHVRGGNSIGVLGTHVQFISRKTGDTIGVITDENGYFEARGLELNDTFYIYTAPVKKLDSLPGIYSNVQSEFCPGSYIGSFFSPCGAENDGIAQGITLTSSNRSVDVGTISISCELRTNTDYSYQKTRSELTTLNVYDYAVDQRLEKTFTGYFLTPSETDWSEPDVLEIDLRSYTGLAGSQKYLKVNLVSQPLGTQLEYQLSVIQNGIPLPAFDREIFPSSLTGTFFTDMEVLLPLSSTSSNNIFEVKLISRKLDNTTILRTFPSSDIFSTSRHLPYFLMMSVWQASGSGSIPVLDSETNLSDNIACLDAPFTFKVKSASVPDGPSDGSGVSAAAAASCGTIDSSGGDDGPSTPGLMVGFILSFMLLALLKRAKNFLS